MNRRRFLAALAGAFASRHAPSKPRWAGIDMASGPDVTALFSGSFGRIDDVRFVESSAFCARDIQKALNALRNNRLDLLDGSHYIAYAHPSCRKALGT